MQERILVRRDKKRTGLDLYGTDVRRFSEREKPAYVKGKRRRKMSIGERRGRAQGEAIGPLKSLSQDRKRRG